MANPSSPSRAPRNAPQRKVHRYIDASFTDDFGRQSKLTVQSANGFARKKLDAAAQSLQSKGERREKQLRRIEIREWRAAERSIAAELRESDHRIRLMWRSLKTKVRPEKKVWHTPPRERKRHWPYAAVALPKYDGPVIDRSGQRGVFMRMRYYSRRTAEQGVSQRVVRYCFNGAELDPDGNPYVATNVGLTIDEALCGFDHLEQVNWWAAKNAKLLMHGIFAVDHRQSPDEMMTCGVRWAEETLGRFDLPYLVTLHAPPPDGDQRNWHLHILWSFRPMVRTGDHEWQVGEMLRTDLDNPDAMKVFREMFAAVMTDMSFEAGQNQVWTAKSNVDRGLPHEPQVHLGGAKTNQARNGEEVAENEENHERVMRSKAAVIDDALRHADEALTKAQDTARAIAARFVRLPALPMPLLGRLAAATMTLDVAMIRTPPPLSSAPIVAPLLMPIRTETARIAGSLELAGSLSRPSPPSTASVVTLTPPRPLPQAARVEIANLRFRSLPLAKEIGGMPGTFTRAPARLTIPVLSELPRMPTLRLAEIGKSIAPPPTIPRASIAQLPGLAPLRTMPRLAGLDTIERALDRIAEAKQRDDERRSQEQETVERDRRAAATTVSRQQALDRMMLAIRKERRFITRTHGNYMVPIDVLERFDVSAGAAAAPDAQRQLASIAEQQASEISQIAGYVSGGADRLRREGGGWALDDAAPLALQRLVDAWSADPLANAAFTRFVKTAPPAPGNALEIVDPAAVWRSARHIRVRAMEQWDDGDPPSNSGRTLPGRQLRRPGSNRAARSASPAQRGRSTVDDRSNDA